jgi:hypothetical protein
MNRPAIDFSKQPWKHPAVWRSHMIEITRERSDNGGPGISVASCECGWSSRIPLVGGGHVAQDNAINAHWHGVITAADGTPAQ